MTNEQLLTQLSGRVAALEFLLTQTMTFTFGALDDSQWHLNECRKVFDERADKLEATLPEAVPAALESATRIYGVVEDHLPAPG